jgi:hypothetical protein
LFAEPGHFFSIADSVEPGERRQNILHGTSPETGKKNNKKSNQTEIILSGSIVASIFIEVRETEELGRVYPGSGDAGVG